MRSMPWRNSSMLITVLQTAFWMATIVASQGAWKGGSLDSRSTEPKPCIPPRSWMPFMQGSIREDEGWRAYPPRPFIPHPVLHGLAGDLAGAVGLGGAAAERGVRAGGRATAARDVEPV